MGTMCYVRRIAPVVLWSLLAVGAPSAAHAQAGNAPEDRPLEAGVGYQFLRSTQTGFGQNYPIGFNLQLSRDLKVDDKKAIGFTGRYGMALRSDEEFSDRLSTFLFGPRIIFGKGDVRPFVRGFAGIARSHTTIKFDEDLSYSDTALMVGGGGGIQKVLGQGRSVELFADYSKILEESYKPNVFGFGLSYTVLMAKKN